jgi:hypothetical protein
LSQPPAIKQCSFKLSPKKFFCLKKIIEFKLSPDAKKESRDKLPTKLGLRQALTLGGAIHLERDENVVYVQQVWEEDW